MIAIAWMEWNTPAMMLYLRKPFAFSVLILSGAVDAIYKVLHRFYNKSVTLRKI